MSESSHSTGGTGPSHRSVEIGVALFMALLAAVGIAGSLKVGIGWGRRRAEGRLLPVLHLADRADLLRRQYRAACCASSPAARCSPTWGQLRQVLSVVIPTTVYVFAVPVLGMYVSSGLLIAVFMKWIGRYSWPMVLAIAIGVPILTFILFERWFLVPLPKGPLEDWLGL